ncbi:sigma-54-dependent transcriptional regulator [Vulgatibacter incomptus]|uniref:Response regulator of zinc sigma-54-dependent two-component system n=1 Tax=Vulgatibacter incomptus TaxID=1391653 RepID=A0A0K1PA33_9BACT|nr:sigma-54 dependent transcriptional regulator [Vulgatibacter incomptus]AKU90362.1 Response regulator of zinc sigma-54-dependent two-component system [Vulgatibacter incomptus]
MFENARILIVDDEEPSREALGELLSRWGMKVEEAGNGRHALRRAIETRPDVIVTDLVMPQMDGLWLLRTLREELPDTPVVLLTGRGTIDQAVEAIREGAYDFLEKPVDGQRLRIVLQRALEKKATLHEVAALRQRLKSRGDDRGFLGTSSAMRRLFSLIERVAPSKTSVVVTGESGTGKEMVAKSVHDLSPRAQKPFVAINCSAIPASLMEAEIFGHEKGAFTGADQRRLGCFELADGGTIFLDEVGELPIELQSKFLRVLEEERLRRLGGKSEIAVDVRVICATNRDLKSEIKAGRFREDLYFRLNVFHLEVSPLRERPEDIPLLAQHFLEKFAAETGKRVQGLDADALEVLSAYAWPGNVRELRNTIERAVILCDGDLIGCDCLPPEMAGGAAQGIMLKLSLGMQLREVEKEYILGSLRQNGGNKARTAERLGISEKTLYNKLNRYAADARERQALPEGNETVERRAPRDRAVW